MVLVVMGQILPAPFRLRTDLLLHQSPASVNKKNPPLHPAAKPIIKTELPVLSWETDPIVKKQRPSD